MANRKPRKAKARLGIASFCQRCREKFRGGGAQCQKCLAPKAIAVLDPKAVLRLGEAPLDLIQTMWGLYTDWCLWSPVAWYTSFGEWMRIVLFENEAASISDHGREEHRRKQGLARILLPSILAEYGLTLDEEASIYIDLRERWRDSGRANNGDGFDGWLGELVAKGAKTPKEAKAADTIKAHLRGVRAGMLGTSSRVPEIQFPKWLLAAIEKDSRLSTEIPLSRVVSGIEKMADEIRRRPPTKEEKMAERGRGIHGWGF